MRDLSMVLGGLLVSAILVAAPAATAAGKDPCAGVSGCRVVAEVDVDGNGSTNQVGLVRRGADGAENGSFTLRVAVGDRVVTATRTTTYWYGPLWEGAADVDGRRGKELYVGRIAGAHTLFFSAFAYRDGRLVEVRAPGPGEGKWVVDSAYTVHIGWWRTADDPPGVVRLKQADRNGTGDTFDARIKTFHWTPDGWVRTSFKRIPRASEDRVSGWGGFHIRGLQRF